MLKINKEYNSPNFGSRPEGTKIDTIIIHYTDMYSNELALKRLCDPKYQVSSHYLIHKNGLIYALVPDAKRAWHAGPSSWRGRSNVNDFSIGIELDNQGFEEFTPLQMDSLISLCKDLKAIHPISPFNIVGHSDITPSRKFDPGRLFNWKILAENKIGVYPRKFKPSKIPEIVKIQEMLAKYGYKISITKKLDSQTIDVMRAFQEHFNPSCYMVWSELSQGILEELISLI